MYHCVSKSDNKMDIKSEFWLLLNLFLLEYFNFLDDCQSRYLLSRLSRHTKVFSKIALVKLSNFYVTVSETHFSVRDLRNFIFFPLFVSQNNASTHSSFFKFNINILAHSFKMKDSPNTFCITQTILTAVFQHLEKFRCQSDPITKC